MAEISSVHLDIARFCREVYQRPDDAALGRWARELAECLVSRDHALSDFGAFLLREVEEYRRKEAERKKGRSKESTDSKDSALSKESTDSKDSALSVLIQSDNHSGIQENKRTLPPQPPVVEPATPEVLRILASYPRKRPLSGGGEESVHQGEADKKAVVAFMAANPSYPLLFAVENYARTTRRPMNLTRFLENPPVLERVLADQKRFIAQNQGAANAA